MLAVPPHRRDGVRGLEAITLGMYPALPVEAGLGNKL
jgi:hypothetical protein